MTRVAVSKSILRWALERSSKPSAVARKFPKLSEWESGKSQPTLKQLEQFAKVTSTPFGYLFLSEPPIEQLSIPHFRTLDDKKAAKPSPDLLETVRTLEQRQAWMREYLENQGHDALPFVNSAQVKENPKSVSEKIKEALGLRNGWAASQRTWTDALIELRRRIEDVGITVIINGVVGNNTRRTLDPKEFRGFVLVDEFAPFVFINGADGKAAQMFTLAHELAHIWLGMSAAFDLRQLQPATDATEEACNKIAAEFLVPEDDLKTFWRGMHRNADRFEQIARQFKVSSLVAARRAQDLSLITKAQFFDFYEEYLKREKHRKDNNESTGGSFYLSQNLRVGRPFGEAVARATKEGSLLYREAYNLTGLYGNVFERFVKDLAGRKL